MKGLNSIFAGKVPGLPKLEEGGENTSERVLDNVMNRKLDLKGKGDALKMKFNTGGENAVFAKLKTKNNRATFEKYLKFSNKQGQEQKVWNMIRPRQLGRDIFSRNEIIAPGNEDVVPDTQDVRAWAAEAGVQPEEAPTTRQKIVRYGEQAADVIDVGLQKSGKAFKSGYQYGKQKAGVLKENWDRLRPTKAERADMTGSEAIDKLNQMRQSEARKAALSDPKFLEGIEKKRIEYEIGLQQQKAQANFELAKQVKQRELGLLPRQTMTTGTGKNKRTVMVPYVGEEGGFGASGPFSATVLPRTAQADWRRYVSSNLPGSEKSIGAAISGGALASREQSIINATRVGGSPENILFATRTGGGVNQILSSVKNYDQVLSPGGLSGPDKLRWMIASPEQRQQMLQLLQQTPAPVMQAPVQQQQVAYTESAAPKAVPAGATYSPYSKKTVTYVRGPYRKTR